jgi:hypothetical protein
MSGIIEKRVCAEIDGPFVLFLIGIRINRWWKPWAWMPVFSAMPKMLIELARNPELELLHARTHFGLRNTMLVQYWRSYEHLEKYALARDRAHLPAQSAFNRAIGTNGDVGIWHETYLIEPGKYENIYGNMPPWGMGVAGRLLEATGPRALGRGRMKATALKAVN